MVNYRPGLRVSPEACAESPGRLPPLGRTVADETPDKCDDKLWGRWYCGSGRSNSRNTLMILSRTIDENNFEKIRQRFPEVGNETIYTVDREWHPNPLTKDRLSRASCNGVDELGYRKLTISQRNADLSDPTGKWVDYVVDSNGLLWKTVYKLRRDGDKTWGEKVGSLYCRREEL